METLELQGQWVVLGTVEHPDLQELQELLEQLDQRVRLETPVQLAPQVHQEQPDLQVRRDPLDLLELQEALAVREPLVQLVVRDL